MELRTRGRLLDLHCSVALTEWDLDQELRLQTTTDQDGSESLFLQKNSRTRRKDDFTWYDKSSDSFVRPNLWLMVNPNVACPIRYPPQTTPPPPQTTPPPPQTTPPPPQTTPQNSDAQLQEETVHSSSTNQHMICSEAPSGGAVKSRRKQSSSKRSDRCAPGCGFWPRPPVNYCLLIGLALKYSGSLRVQQIYNFTRELFPFFQTAPDGWKNTIRHNLCFNNSFKKNFTQSRTDRCDREQQGRQTSRSETKRKSCCWHLTTDGHRRLRDELLTLTPETLKQLELSAANPELIRALLSL